MSLFGWGNSVDDEAKRVLDRRLAAGDITKEDYLETLRLMSAGVKHSTGRRVTNNEPKGLVLRVNRDFLLCADCMFYKGERIVYEDIFSLYYYAYRHSINFIPVYSTEEVHIVVLHRETIVLKPSFRSSLSSLLGMSPFRKAYSYLSERTWDQRCKRYLADLRSKGAVDLPVSPKTSLHADGKLQQGNSVASLRDPSNKILFGRSGIVSSDPYEVTVGGSLMRPPSMSFTVGYDRDVVFMLLKALSSGEAER